MDFSSYLSCFDAEPLKNKITTTIVFSSIKTRNSMIYIITTITINKTIKIIVIIQQIGILVIVIIWASQFVLSSK